MLKSDYYFHPHEIAFCGYSNSGKTTLLNKLIESLAKDFKVAYVKHDAHKFQMDREGKDTYRAAASGAKEVLINDSSKFAYLVNEPLNPVQQKNLLSKCDLVLIEGYKESTVPKVLFIDEKQEIRQKFNNLKNIIAFTGSKDKYPDLPSGIPYIQRDNVEDFRTLILNYLKQKAELLPLYGLFLFPAEISENEPAHIINLLKDYCQEVFIDSVNTKLDSPRLKETFINMGLAGKILSAQNHLPDSAFLVVSGDITFINKKTVEYLFRMRDPSKNATIYLKSGQPEPFFGIYEPNSRTGLLHLLAAGQDNPKLLLKSGNVRTIEVPYQEKVPTVLNNDIITRLKEKE